VQGAVLLAGLEGEQHRGARQQHPPELGEQRRQMRVGHMDHRVQRHDPAERRGRQVQVGHRPHVEAQPGMRLAGQRHHAGREIHAEHRQPRPVQPGGDVTGPAAQVRDRGGCAVLAAARQFREGGQQRAFQGLIAQAVRVAVGVLRGEGVVRGAGAVQELRLGCAHGPEPSQHTRPVSAS